MTDITPQTLRHILNSWWSRRQFPAAWLDAFTPETAGKTAIYRSIAAFEHLHSVGWEGLMVARRRVGRAAVVPPQTLDDMRESVRRDFSVLQIAAGDDLMVWSAVYHQHLAAVRVQQEALAGWAGMSERNLRRLTLVGLGLLCAALMDAHPQIE